MAEGALAEEPEVEALVGVVAEPEVVPGQGVPVQAEELEPGQAVAAGLELALVQRQD